MTKKAGQMAASTPELPRNLVLIGGRGCGKSSIARRVLRREKRFLLLSTDDLIRYECDARSIPEIVEDRGWRGFREVERRVVDKVAAFEQAALIDCGGGVVIELDAHDQEVFSDAKVSALRRHGVVIYLQRSTDYLLGRIAGDHNRPSLSAQESFIELMTRRDPLYRRAAHHVLEAGELAKPELVERVLSLYRQH